MSSSYGAVDHGAMERGFRQFFLGGERPEKGEEEQTSPQSLAPKAIGAVGSFAIFINAIVGPGLLSLPKVFDDAGALVPSALLLFGFLLAALSTIARCETVALMPDNSNFERVVEFCDPALKFVGRRCYYFCHVMFYLASMSMAIASIILVAETADIVIAKIFRKNYALTWREGLNFVVWSIENCQQQSKCKPFITGNQVRGGDLYVTLGYVVTFAVIFPVSSTERIAEGMALQYTSCLVTAVAIPLISCKSLYRAVVSGSHLSLFLTGPKANSASGVVLFNLMYGIFVSTWLCEKKREVSVSKTVYRSSFVGALTAILYASSVAASTRQVASDGLLDATEQGEPLPVVAAALFFGFFVIASGIPICCIMARHNLVSSTIKLVDPAFANVLCHIFPWTVAWLFYASPPYRSLVNYSGLLVVSWLSLWMPFFVLLHAIDPPPDPPPEPTTTRGPSASSSSEKRPFAAHSSSSSSSEEEQFPTSCGPWQYLKWFGALLVAPPDDDVDTILSPLPNALGPYARNVYAALLLVVTTWILGALVSYVVAFIALTDSTIAAHAEGGS
mmetsp:Transcript_20203/g.65075  ORF Transcript_20203/g.65075 Transcript_20203/m.65075 type:complete len:561 (-) Transcript_20203:994-2676(-)